NPTNNTRYTLTVNNEQYDIEVVNQVVRITNPQTGTVQTLAQGESQQFTGVNQNFGFKLSLSSTGQLSIVNVSPGQTAEEFQNLGKSFGKDHTQIIAEQSTNPAVQALAQDINA
ncbi:hypothetical protein RZS08_62685, partial [Arthrospira platensis SPKY1]|nr:hypothetical protein [Arthrospira platensis SPKY1]